MRAGSPPASLLTLAHISHSFGTTTALDDVSFEVAPGEVHALLGENGAGKSTLMRVAYGLIAPVAGQVTVNGTRVRTPREARRLGLGMVHQHFTAVAAFTVAENLALAAGWSGSRRNLERHADAVMSRLGLPLDPMARADSLSVQLRQRLEIVQALASDARALLLDEPTAVLAPREATILLDWIGGFAASGGTVVLITHRLREALAVADRVTVLRRGRVVLSDHAQLRDEAALARAMFGETARRPPVPRAAIPPTARDVAVRIGDRTLHRGEVVGIAAIEGNGHRELLRTLAGLVAARDDVEVHGTVGFIPEDRTTEALILGASLAENHLLGNLDRTPQWLDWGALTARTTALLDAHQVRAAGPAARAGSLSGGNQQRFVLGRTLDRSPDVVVAEHPTRGLDLGATVELYRRLREAAGRGACVVVHSPDLDELLEHADRLLVLHAGVVHELSISAPRDLVGDAMLGLT